MTFPSPVTTLTAAHRSARVAETHGGAGTPSDGTTLVASFVLSGVVPSGSLHTRRSLRALRRVTQALAEESKRFQHRADFGRLAQPHP